METKRKTYGYLTAKVYGKKPDAKTIAIRFERNDIQQAMKMARAILQAMEDGKGADITIFKNKPRKDGKVAITITAK